MAIYKSRKKSGSLSLVEPYGILSGEGWYFNDSGVLRQDQSNSDKVVLVFRVRANHSYIFCWGGSKVGNVCTVALTTQDIYSSPLSGLSCTLCWSDTTKADEYYAESVPDIVQDSYLGAYIADDMGTDVECYLIDITDIGA